jgi:hypothetical protein
MGMGGREFGRAREVEGRIYLRKVRLDRGGYDPSGSYWGGGAPLYEATDGEGEFQRYVRAPSREAAADKLEIRPKQLKASKARDRMAARRAATKGRYARYFNMHGQRSYDMYGRPNLADLRKAAMKRSKYKRTR